MALQQAKGLQNALVRGPLAPVDAVAVVQRARPVQAEADKKPLGREKAAPFFVQQGAVGLYAVQNLAALRPVLALQRDDAAEIR